MSKTKTRSSIASLLDRIDKLEDALRPLAALAPHYRNHNPAYKLVRSPDVTVADVLFADAVLHGREYL